MMLSCLGPGKTALSFLGGWQPEKKKNKKAGKLKRVTSQTPDNKWPFEREFGRKEIDPVDSIVDSGIDANSRFFSLTFSLSTKGQGAPYLSQKTNAYPVSQIGFLARKY